MSCQMATQGVWINLCCRMWVSGSGSISRTKGQFARLLGISVECMLAALLDLQQTGTAEIDPLLDIMAPPADAVITVTSRRLLRELSEAEKKRSQWRERTRRQRERIGQVSHINLLSKESLFCHAIVTPLDKEKDKDLDQDPEETIDRPSAGPVFDFKSAYARYPRKEGKAKGLAKLKASIKTRAAFDRFDQALNNYVKKVEVEQIESTFIMQFSTFAGGRWEDYVEYVPSPKNGKATPGYRSPMPAAKETYDVKL